MPTCSAYGCTSSTRHKGNREKGIFFHDFPKREKSPERFRHWVDYCNRKDFDPGISQKSACLCSRHFQVSDMDESQLLKIRMMPSLNLRGPRLKPGTVPTVVFDSVMGRKTSKIPSIPMKRKKTEWDEPSKKKLHFSNSLMNWRKSLGGKLDETLTEETSTTSNKYTQCEIGLEMYRYVSSTNKKCDQKEGAEDMNPAELRIKRDNDSDSSDLSSSESDNENDNSAANNKETSFAAWGNLLLLFRICNVCSNEVTDVQHGMKCNKIFVKSRCSCGNRVTWTSKPK